MTEKEVEEDRQRQRHQSNNRQFIDVHDDLMVCLSCFFLYTQYIVTIVIFFFYNLVVETLSMGNKIVLKSRTSKELSPQSLLLIHFFINYNI